MFLTLLLLLLSCLVCLLSDYVTVKQDENDIWWFEHNGNKFLSMGVNHVNNGGWDDGVGGEESSLCQQMTGNSLCGDTLSFCGSLGYSPYYNNTQLIYNNNTNIWANNVMQRLKLWGFNTVSGWSSTLIEQLAQNNSMYYAHLLDMGTTWITHSDGLDYDVFSYDFYNHCDSIGKNSVLPRSTDEYLLGWQLDNEIWWHKIGIKKYLNYSENSSGYNRCILYLQTYFNNNLTLLNLEWNITAKTWNDIKNYIYDNRDLNKFKFNVNNEEFLFIVSQQYFNVTTNAIKRYDENHLILGVRNFGLPEYVRLALSSYVDTIDKHCYGNPQLNKTCWVDDNPCANLDNIYLTTHKPIYIGEFSFVASDSGLPNTIGARHNCVFESQQQRADAYTHYVKKFISYKYSIGFHWWQYADEPAEGRWPDGENSNYGLVDIWDNPYYDVVTNAQQLNPTLFDLHNNL